MNHQQQGEQQSGGLCGQNNALNLLKLKLKNRVKICRASLTAAQIPYFYQDFKPQWEWKQQLAGVKS